MLREIFQRAYGNGSSRFLFSFSDTMHHISSKNFSPNCFTHYLIARIQLRYFPVRTSVPENALLLVTRTINKVIIGEIQLRDSVVSKMLRQDLNRYRSLFPHVSAALQLKEVGKSLVRVDIIQYIYTDAAHKNALHRIMPIIRVNEEHDYDKEK